MTDITLARALHVVAVVLWIGGVAMVTTILLPVIRRRHAAPERMAQFHVIEHGFARQSRWTTALTGASGFYMAWRLELWDRFAMAEFWWMHAMVLTWAVFTVMLFVLEPLFLDAYLQRAATRRPEATYRRVETLHRVLLGLGLLTVAGAVAGVHGLTFFDW
ncbi:conserved membrane protein of unknown function [Rhodovastum atsumiense]|uniref:Copper resistance protein D domain-containing protein n=1 Tax=Rhodovastum atsumiense TaxID=504468 RepID=A0A5M6IYU1_9PROT|nr:hypothetical protein [Rhodovastum atsumiense]KAA5612538.1 hypothetical protein F1189_08755 [Rhodovastum atsumiense]CAH2601380.1 conserved membrane protein of unknown function [Rhodovastum atsumiense]